MFLPPWSFHSKTSQVNPRNSAEHHLSKQLDWKTYMFCEKTILQLANKNKRLEGLDQLPRSSCLGQRAIHQEQVPWKNILVPVSSQEVHGS